MAYDLHLTRADDWSEGLSRPITTEELVDACRQVGFTLRSDGSDAFQLRRIAPGKADVDLMSAHVFEGQVTLKPFPPDQDAADRVTLLAAVLEARVQGDDGEVYERAPVLRIVRRPFWRRG
ncbi:hypothetical protein GCM10009767_16910 [Kocuria aegyptia]|uniref:Uncharacterized protein n=1 Tax=Kocuria aegyptia TaxID=330943 RepID=A0ABN2KLV3_9MICC